jgi:acyl carrier protein
MAKSGAHKLTFKEFQALLSEELVIPSERLVADADLVQDLQVDSLALASMMLRLEELGIDVPLESAWEIHTVGEAYELYKKNAGAAA